uniref:EF-hand domain-containing protein n=1 Tax=Phaeomonas parva TaxID=124430 RepID=A0A7S1TRY6_9STRA|mmetsp:Transcript_15124/g.45560  ORF Transcript_15124/g.45560 Transcript_15124/m.45560 type:complete len:648 (+) Transcript_15124:420-2363(+)
MGRHGQKVNLVDTLTPQELRIHNRKCVREENELPKNKWAAFQEQQRREERASMQFTHKLLNSKAAPNEAVTRVMQRIKVAVNQVMKKRGGTAMSILRSAFLNWDSDASGEMNPDELVNACRMLGVLLSRREAVDLIEYYDQEGDGEIKYTDLLEDISKGAPHFLQHAVGSTPRLPPDEIPEPKVMPGLVKDFIGRLRQLLLKKMRVDGGTEFSIIRKVFLGWDADQSGQLDKEELRGAARDFGLRLSAREAGIIVDYYSDTEGAHEMSYQKLVKDLTNGTTHYLQHISGNDVRRELESARARSTCRTEREVFFTARPKRKPRNMMVEALKVRIRRRLEELMKEKGGTVTSHIREVFLFWDGDASGKLDAGEVKGALQRLHIYCSDDEASAMVHYYDAGTAGEMSYELLIQDVSRGVPSLLEQEKFDSINWTTTMSDLGNFRPAPEVASTAPSTERFSEMRLPVANSGAVTVRIPGSVRTILSNLQTAVESAAAQKNLKVTSMAQQVSGRDYFHGTLLRKDTRGSGVLSGREILAAIRDMHITSVREDDVTRLAQWFHRGDGKVPYETMINEIWGPQRVVTQRSAPTSGRVRPTRFGAAGANSLAKSGLSNASLGKTGSVRKRQILAEKRRIEKRLLELTREEQAGRR